MPVEPIPCGPDGGTGTPGACSCSPSIASAPLCRADGSLVLVVLRSGCADCAATPQDPAVIGWVDPLTGNFTAGAVPPDAGPCSIGCSCSPSIATNQMCRADGSTVLVVVRSDCADCDTPAANPVVAGWIDPLTGVFTPGAALADVGQCDTGCVDTICRQLCDDTDGDGQADATYSELWCIKADGSATLVLTYQDDPSTPYVPTAPVDCTYGCADSETVTLCDDSGPFLRRYQFLDGSASYVDVALDGQTPHVVTGTVGVCTDDSSSGTQCAEQTTPAATLGLCLADGTPIAVVVTRDCNGTVTQDGWLNLTTGAWAAGDPPTGTLACGDSRSIQVSGTFCDVLPDGTIAGLVLIEYHYDDAGAIDSVRLVDAVTGTTYVPQGQVTTCPTGEALPERDLVQLCDTAGSGAATPFVRDYARNDTGAITGHTDYLLDGTPYTPTGTVGICAPDAEPGVDVELLPMCVIDNTSGGILQRILAEIRYDTETGTRLSVNFVDPITWGPVALPGGTHLDVCPPPDTEECATQNVLQACRCDDADGDGIADTDYVELLAVDCTGAVTSLGSYTADLSAPYTPVAPISCDETDEGADPAVGVQARRVELAAGETWDAATWPTLQSVTAVAHGGTGTVTTEDGPSTLHTGEAATWSVGRDTDALLTGPLTVTADTGTVTLSYTIGVTL
ncbi:hypothetical protein [Streptomyces sp. NPDC001068]|uniref:hypothetical protein n=1 Tax=Streptomyces sp. NPDC001068 TaxID=3364544 RepID=UPI0036A82751